MVPTQPVDRALLVEVGWEVCLQLGGIYTVLKTKSAAMKARWGDRYCMIGPYQADAAGIEFEELPRTGMFGKACDLVAQEYGVKVYFGKWLVPGEPQVVLIDYNSSRDRLAEFKYFLWKDHQISLGTEPEVDDVVLFGYLVADFLQVLSRVVHEEDEAEIPILAHFHEWMAGVPIPVILRRNLPISTVFTTHATILGRYLASDHPNFYQHLTQIDPHREAANRNIYPRFAIERAATWGATCFTTISEITALEAEHLLGRKPDVLLPNGLNIRRFAAVHEFQNLHLIYKKRIQEFLMGHFFPRYTFDLSKTLHIFTSGRYEFRNKGMDVFIEGLARLNWRLKHENKDVTVVAFIITRAATHGFNVDVLKNQMLFKEMSNHCETMASGVSSKLLTSTASGTDPRTTPLLDESELHTLKRLTRAWRQTHLYPNIVTHNLAYDADDPIMNALRKCRLFNSPEDRVKIVYHPDFLTAASPILGLDYDQFVRGCHLGVFPSYYEPWGYTPEECAALGIPSITSDLAGFGGYVRQNVPMYADKGLFVIERREHSFEESAQLLTESIYKVVTMNMRERIELRNRVEAVSSKFDWKELTESYHRAHRIALARTRKAKLGQ